MNTRARSGDARRVIVGLRSAKQLAPSIEAATTLAQVIEAELVGLFVEDEAVIDLAGLPFAQALSVGASEPTQLEPNTILKAFSLAATEMKRKLSINAQRARLKWSFTCQRGEWRQTVQAVARREDFVVLCGEPALFEISAHLRDMRSMLAHAHGLLVAHRLPAGKRKGPVVVIDDGDALGGKTVQMGQRIAAALGVPLHLFAIAGNVEAAADISRRAERLCPAGTTLTVQRFPPGATDMLASVILHESPSFVVADLDGEPFTDDKAARRILTAAQAPVVFLSRQQTDSSR
jgi:hypothetical protein